MTTPRRSVSFAVNKALLAKLELLQKETGVESVHMAARIACLVGLEKTSQLDTLWKKAISREYAIAMNRKTKFALAKVMAELDSELQEENG